MKRRRVCCKRIKSSRTQVTIIRRRGLPDTVVVRTIDPKTELVVITPKNTSIQMPVLPTMPDLKEIIASMGPAKIHPPPVMMTQKRSRYFTK